MQKIVIIGGGFAGLNLANQLCGSPEFLITLVDQNNYYFFSPLLSQIATGFMSPQAISFTYRKIFHRKYQIQFLTGELIRLLPDQSRVVLSTGQLEYDKLIIATGLKPNFHGLLNIKEKAFSFKTLTDAIALRNHFFSRLEDAVNTPDENSRKQLLTFVIAGAGPAGVEIAGMLAAFCARILPRDYPVIAAQKDGFRILLLEKSDTLLPAMSAGSQRAAVAGLTEMGVTIHLETGVTDYFHGRVTLTTGLIIESKTLISALGITGNVFDGIPVENYGSDNRLLVNRFNELECLANIYAIGDCCYQTHELAYPDSYPQLAQVARQQGRQLGLNLKRSVLKQRMSPFRYKDRGHYAMIGRNRFVADLRNQQSRVQGITAWFSWIIFYLLPLIVLPLRVKIWLSWLYGLLRLSPKAQFVIKSCIYRT